VQNYRHQPGVPVSCPVSVLIGADDRTSTADDVLAWRQHTTGPFRSAVFPGGHFFLNTEARAVLALLEKHLAPGVARGLDGEGALLG
jgi:surfactin synthase thioesterase subunit